MIIFFMLMFMVTAKPTEETKYIDLLPEKEKEIFLNRIARRILEEVDVKPSQKKSGEVPEHELDIHDEFIKKILQEEQANLRKHNTNDKDDLSVKPLQKDRKTIDLTLRSRTKRNKDENLRRNLDANSDLENNKQQDISTSPSSKSDEKDIQVKAFNIKSDNNNDEVEKEANNDEVQTISTDNVNVDTEKPTTEHIFGNINETKINNTKETNLSILNVEKRSFLSNISQNINDENQQENKPIDKKEISTKLDLSSDKEKQEILHSGDFVKIGEEITTKLEEPPTEKVTHTTTPKLVDNTEIAGKGKITTETNISEVQAKEITKGDVNAVTDKIETKMEVNDDKTEKLPIKNFRINTVNFGDTEKSKTNTINNTNNNLFTDLESTFSVTLDSKPMRVKPLIEKHNSDKNEEIVSASSEKLDIISEVHKDIIAGHQINKDVKGTLKSIDENHKNGEDTVKPNIYYIQKISQRDTEGEKPVSQQFEVTTQKIETLTPLIPLNNIKQTTTKYSTRTEKNDVKDVKEADSDIIRVLREVIDRNRIDANGKFDGLESINKVKEHNVYELPSSDKMLYIDGTMKDNKEQPYYYPIYNYSPNNAFYNAHNNFGPNQNDFEIQSNTDREVDGKGTDNFQTDYFFAERNNRFTDFDTSEYSNQANKLPLIVKLNPDYDGPAILRNNNGQSNKDDDDDTLKTNLRQVRLMMYANQWYGKPRNTTFKYTGDNIDINTDVNTDVNADVNADVNTEVTTEGSSDCAPENISWDNIEQGEDSTEDTEKSYLRTNFEAILEREKKERKSDDISDISIDYFFSLIKDKSKTKKKDEAKKIHTNKNSIRDVIQTMVNKNNYKVYIVDPAQSKSTNTIFKSRKNEKKPNLQKKPNIEKIWKILNMTNEVDMIPTLNKLLQMNIKRSMVDSKNVEVYADVLADLVQTDNSALVQYDWLGTTVNIQGATLKLLELTQLVLHGRYVNPSDLELLKYVVHLFKQANIMVQYQENLRMKLPRERYRKNGILLKPLTQFLFRHSEKNYVQDELTRKDMEIFEEFLEELLNSLYEFHTAVKNIASVTKYNHQRWFKNLKELVLDRTPIRNLELLLHLTVNRVLDLVEDSAKDGLEYNYLKYERQNVKQVERTIDEIVFLLKVKNAIEKNE